LDYNIHIYGCDNDISISLIRENDRLIQFAIENMQPDSLILAFGDHGVMRKGGHGGGTKEELEAGFFAFTHKDFTFRKWENLLKSDLIENYKEKYLIKLIITDLKFDSILNRKEFSQIDLVPTMSAIFNIPIPYSNLGIIIPELLNYNNYAPLQCVFELLIEYTINFLQVWNYVNHFNKISGEMSKQTYEINTFYKGIYKEINKTFQKYKEINQIEKEFLKNNTLQTISLENQQKISDFVTNTNSIILRIKSELKQNSQKFKSQWTSINSVFMYSSIFLGISIILILVVIVIAFSFENIVELAISEFKNLTFINNGYYLLGIMGFFAITLLISSMENLWLCILYGITGLTIFSGFKIVKQIYRKIWENKINFQGKIAIFMALLLIFGQIYGYTTFIMTSQEKIVYYLANLAIIFFILLTIIAQNSNKFKTICYAIIISFIYKFTSEFSYFQEVYTKNFTLCSVIPSLFIFLLAEYSIILKNTNYAMKIYIRAIYAILFMFSFTGVMFYQSKEVDGMLKFNNFTYITLPRLVYLINLIQLIYLFIGLFIPGLIWKTNMNISQNIKLSTYFAMILTSFMPSLLMIYGPYQQILFLGYFIMIYFSNYIFKQINIGNTLFQYIFYSFLSQNMFHVTGHVLDFMLPKVERTFVGFPEFNTFISFGIALLDSVGSYSFIILLIPILTNEHEKENEFTYLNNIEERQLTPQKLNDIKNPELQISRNYFIILLHFEMIHMGITRFLVANFEKLFFEVARTEFTFRFIDWYIYLAITGCEFIISKLT